MTEIELRQSTSKFYDRKRSPTPEIDVRVWNGSLTIDNDAQRRKLKCNNRKLGSTPKIDVRRLKIEVQQSTTRLDAGN